MPEHTRARMASSHLNQMMHENESARARIAQLEIELQLQAKAIEAAQRRKEELSALRSASLLRFARVHAEEESARRALSDCRRGIETAWDRIKGLQDDNAALFLELQHHEALDAKHRKRYEELAETIKRTERRASLGTEILEEECQALITQLRAEDAQRQSDEQAELAERDRQAAEARTAAAAAAAAMAATLVTAGAQEAAEAECLEGNMETRNELEIDQPTPSDSTTGAGTSGPTTDAELETSVLAILTSGRANTATILSDPRCAGVDAARLERILRTLKDAWLCYEAGGGYFAAM